MTTKALITGSLGAIAQRENISLAESFLSADVLLIVDMSGSMSMYDAPDGLSRYEAAENELKRLQEQNPGKIAVIAFSDTAEFAPTGIPRRIGNGTNLAGALSFVKPADGTGVRFIVISDGEPDDKERALATARTFESKIDCVYIGPESSGNWNGCKFLQQLAAASGGTFAQGDAPGMLAEQVTLQLGASA